MIVDFDYINFSMFKYAVYRASPLLWKVLFNRKG